MPRISLEQQEAKSRAMIEWALYQGLLEGVSGMHSDSTVLDIPLTIHYKDGRKKKIFWHQVKPHLSELPLDD